MRRWSPLIFLSTALASSCAHDSPRSHDRPPLVLAAGRIEQGEPREVECDCEIDRHKCAPDELKLKLAALSYCATVGKLKVAVSAPPESRVQNELDVTLPNDDWKRFDMCFKTPAAHRATVLVSVMALCQSHATVKAAVSCRMPP